MFIIIAQSSVLRITENTFGENLGILVDRSNKEGFFNFIRSSRVIASLSNRNKTSN